MALGIETKIEKTLAASFGAMVAIAAAISYAGLSSVNTMYEVADRGFRRAAEALVAAETLNTQLADARYSNRGVFIYAAAGDRDEVDVQKRRFNRDVEMLRGTLSSLEKLVDSADQLDALRTFREALEGYSSLALEVTALAEAGQSQAGIAMLKTRARPLGTAMEKAAASIAQTQRQSMESAKQQEERERGKAIWTHMGLIVAALFAAGMAFRAVRHVGSNLKTTAGRISASAEELAAAAGQMAATSGQLAVGASNQAVSVKEATASATEMLSYTRATTERATSAADSAAEVDEHVHQAHAVLQHLVESMATIDDSSQQISRVMKVIDEIAFQTNILALNAAVEAARAGAAGSGFAVVADEVRNLAQKCSSAAEQTTTLIDNSIRSSSEGRNKVKEVSDCIGNITKSTAKVKGLIEEVSRGTLEQSSRVETVATGLAQIESITQATATSAEQSAAASQEMLRNSGQVKDLLLELAQTKRAGN